MEAATPPLPLVLNRMLHYLHALVQIRGDIHRLKEKRKAGVLGQQLNEVQMEDGNGGGSSTPAAKVDRFRLLPMTGRFVQEKFVPFFSD